MYSKRHTRHWLKLGIHILKLSLKQTEPTSNLIEKSYDEIANSYDEIWTDHMQHLSEEMLSRLSPPKEADALDLACGTGFVTSKIAELTSGNTTGVDVSNGMLEVARRNHGKHCKFVQSDVMKYLSGCPPKSFDVVTCAWGLGYSSPFRIIKEISRILRPGGRVGIIDNSLFTVYEVIQSALFTVAENPLALRHVLKVRFLPTKGTLKRRMWFCGLHVVDSWKGSKTYYASDGKSAIKRLLNTGTAAGYEFFIHEQYRKEIAMRFAEIFEEHFGEENGVPIIHRYIAAIAEKR